MTRPPKFLRFLIAYATLSTAVGFACEEASIPILDRVGAVIGIFAFALFVVAIYLILQDADGFRP